MLSTVELWNVITGCSSLQDEESIGKELERSMPVLSVGLDYYKGTNVESENKVKSSADVKRKEFILKLSKVLNLDEWLTHELFKNYLRLDFRGSGPQLQNILKHDTQLEGFYLKLLNFYFKERLYVLKCIKYLVTYWQDGSCFYREEFAKIVDQLASQGFINNVIQQLKELLRKPAGHPGLKGNYTAEAGFANEFMREMCELVEIIFLYYNEFHMTIDTFTDLANLFKLHHFGYSHVNKKLLTTSADMDRFGYTSSLVLLGALDMELIRKNITKDQNDNQTESHPLLKNDSWKTIDSLLYTWDDIPQQGPILMGWTIFRHVNLPADEQQLTRLFGDAAISCKVFEYLQHMLENSSYDEVNSGIGDLVKSFVYLVLTLALKIFQEVSLCDYQVLITLASKALSKPMLTSLFLMEDQAGGLSLLLKSAKKQFPYMATPYLKLITAICSHTDGADMVFESFERLETFTEMFSRNNVDEIESVNEKCWKRKHDRCILSYAKDQLLLPAETRGLTFQHRLETRLIQWNYSYSGWLYVILEMGHIIASPFTYSNDSGESGLVLAKHYIELINALLKTSPTKLQDLEPIISVIITLLRRLLQAQTKPLDVIASCLSCVYLVMQQRPLEIWQSLSEIQFLPHQKYKVGTNHPILLPGSYGTAVLKEETHNHSYKVTKEYLKVISQMLSEPYDYVISDITCPTRKKIYYDIAANLVFVIKEVFTPFGTWKFNDAEEKELICLHCLEIFHKVLSPSFQGLSAMTNELLPSLKETVQEGLLYHGAGDSLLAILAVGVDGLEHAIEANSRQKANTIQVIKLSLAVLNMLLTKTQKNTTLARVEELLSQQFVQQTSDLDFNIPVCKVSLLSVITKYIFHRHDPKLTILAVIAIKTLSVRFPLILTACFGDGLVGIRNAFVNKLNGRVEAVRLKVAILELLTACVESQPGIIESFTHIQTDKTNRATFGKFSCLPAVMEILCNKSVVDVLTSAALEFVAALWYNRYDAAMMLLKRNEAFWLSITHYVNVLESIPVHSVTYEVISHALDIIAVETYYVKNAEFDEKLETHLKAVSTESTYERIGKVFSTCSEKSEMKRKLTLISSLDKYVSIMFTRSEIRGNLEDEKISSILLLDTIRALKSWTEKLDDDSESMALVSTLIQQLSNLLWTLVRNYERSSHFDMIMETSCSILQDLPKSNKETFYNAAKPLYSMLLFILQKRGKVKSVDSSVNLLFSLLCDRLQFHKDGESCVHQHHMQINKISICLLTELTKHLSEHSLQMLVKDLQCQGILRNLMHDVSSHIEKNIHLDYVESVFEFLLTCSQKDWFVEHVYNSGFGKFICLDLQNIHRLQFKSYEKIWCMILATTSHLLRKLRHTFLQTAVDFIGAYEEILLKHMNVTEQISTHYGLEITEQLSMFCCELAKYQHDVEFLLPQVFRKIKCGIGEMARLSIAFISRQRLLNHMIESQVGNNEHQMNFNRPLSSPLSVRSDSMISGHSTDRCEKLSSIAEVALSRLISILCYSLAALRHFTPNVVETILDEGMDIQSFSPLVDLKFNSPSLEPNDTPTFGSLISCINISIKMIHKAAQSDSERATPERDGPFMTSGGDTEKRRSLLWFVIENALVIILSQASCYLRHPHIDQGAKQFLKRELGSELTNFMYAVYRFRGRRGVPPSPESSDRSTSSMSSSNFTLFRRSPSKLSAMMSINEEEESSLVKLVDMYTKNLLR